MSWTKWLGGVATAAAVAVAAGLSAPGDAVAGSAPPYPYNVYTCQKDRGAENLSFLPFSSPNFTAGWGSCTGDGYLRAEPTNWALWGQEARLTLTAPAGAMVAGYNLQMLCDSRNGFGSGIRVLDTTYTWIQHRGCFGDNRQGTAYAQTDAWLDGQAHGFEFWSVCYSPSGCGPDGGGVGEVIAKNIIIHMADNSDPQIANVRGSLVNAGWRGAGTYSVAFDATDLGSGISRRRVKIDGSAVLDEGSPCRQAHVNPCPLQLAGTEASVDTSKIADGNHTVTIEVEDLSGRIARTTRTVKIDRTAPAAPRDLEVVPDRWTSNNDFTLEFSTKWTTGDGSPIVGAYVKTGSAPTSPTDGEFLDAFGPEGLKRLRGIKASALGEVPVYVWLRDEAGNVTQANRSEGKLRFDQEPPAQVRVAETGGWINARVARSFVQQFDYPGRMPVSGLDGFATLLTDDPHADPGISPDTSPADPRRTFSLEDGLWWFHVRAISNAGVAGPIGSTLLRVDTVAPEVRLGGASGKAWDTGPIELQIDARDGGSGVSAANGNDPSGVFAALAGEQFRRLSDRRMRLAGDGVYRVFYYAVDVAGNQSETMSRTFPIDTTPPTAVFAREQDPTDPTLIRARATDTMSGIADAVMEYRVAGTGEAGWQPLETQFDRGNVTARVTDDLEKPGLLEFRLRVTDRAGHTTVRQDREGGGQMTLSTPIRRSLKIAAGLTGEHIGIQTTNGPAKSRLRRQAKSLTTAYGEPAALSGTVTDSAGKAAGQIALDLYTRTNTLGAGWRKVATISTRKDGSFRHNLGAGPSRDLRLEIRGSTTDRGAASKILRLRVRAKATLRLRPKKVRNKGKVRFSGVVAHRGTPIPPGGKVVQVEYLDMRLRPPRWRPVMRLRTDSRGRFSGSYRFQSVASAQRFFFSVSVFKDASFAYSQGRTGMASVTVHPRR